jgi:hypothetical protein
MRVVVTYANVSSPRTYKALHDPLMSHPPHRRLALLRLPLPIHPHEPHSPNHNNLLTLPQELTAK